MPTHALAAVYLSLPSHSGSHQLTLYVPLSLLARVCAGVKHRTLSTYERKLPVIIITVCRRIPLPLTQRVAVKNSRRCRLGALSIKCMEFPRA